MATQAGSKLNTKKTSQQQFFEYQMWLEKQCRNKKNTSSISPQPLTGLYILCNFAL